MDGDATGVIDGISNRLGPYETWMFGPGRTYDLQGLQLADQACLSCVAEVPPGVTLERLRRTSVARPGLARYTLPVLYQPDGVTPSFIPFLMQGKKRGAPKLDQVERISDALADFLAPSGAGADAPGYFRLNFPVRAETLDPAYPGAAADAPCLADPAVDARKPLVIAAVIDDGIPFAHAHFRHGSGTRIDYCWSQGAVGGADGAVPFGREFTRGAIDGLVAASAGDEDAVYAQAGLSSRPGLPPMPLDLPESHGAHVLDLAAGRWPATDAAQVRVIAVDLPPTSTWETSGYGTDMFLLSALHYIFDRAAKIAAALGRADDVPVVINLSFGYSGGPHDRSGFLEAAMDELILARRRRAPTALVLPSGNSFQDRLTALIGNADFKEAPGGGTEVAELHWEAPANDGTSSFLEFWYPPGTQLSDIRIEVIAPGTTSPANTGPEQEREAGRFVSTDLTVGGQIVGQFGIDKHRDSRWRASVILAPSEPRALPPGNHAAASAGIWTIRFLRPRGSTLPDLDEPGGPAVEGAMQCRVQIDTHSLQGNTGARQSAFVAPGYVPDDADGAPGSDDPPGPIRRFGNLNALASMQTSLVVGGAVDAFGRSVDYSGAGALRRRASGRGGVPVGEQVDLSAPSDRSGWREGVLGAGTRSGVRFAMRGTSVAAPQVARQLLEAFRDGPVASSTPDNYLALLLARVERIGTPVTAETGRGGRRRLGLLRLHPDAREDL